MTVTHRIKIHPKYIERLLTGQKTFEIRKNDRDYQVGDRLSMYPFYPREENQIVWSFTGMETRNVEAVIIYMTTAYQQDGYCVLGIQLVNEESPNDAK